MDFPALKPGDVFLTSNPMAMGRAIRAVQNIWSKDSKSTYSHAGIILLPRGDTFEALWHVKSQNLFDAYHGLGVMVARHEKMGFEKFIDGYSFIKKENGGDFYPFYRLVFHLAPPLAKFSAGRVVCSELVAKFLNHIGLFPFYNGCTPDNLDDHIRWGKGWSIIFEGKCPVTT